MTEAATEIQRTISVGNGELLRATLSECGVFLWLESSEWPGKFPLYVGIDEDWEAFRQAVEAIRAEASDRAHIRNTVQQLIDPIDGPDGEA
jgi:hypothetical protein